MGRWPGELKKALSASSYGHFTEANEFWSQCHVFRFGNNRRSSRRDLFGGSNCILSQKSVPQEPFGRVKLEFGSESRPAGIFWADQIFFSVGKSSCRGLLGRQDCILSQKSVPQEPFGRIQLHFEPEKHPAGHFAENIWWAANPKSHAIFWKKKPQKALNHVLIS